MIIVQFVGGLGNQMFQYAFYKTLQSKNKKVKADLVRFSIYEYHNGFEIEDIFNISLDKVTPFRSKLYNPLYRSWAIRKLRRLLFLKNLHFEEKNDFIFDSDVFLRSKKKYFMGHWQTEKYFKGIETEIKNDFIFKVPLNTKNQLLSEKVKNTNSVAIHVRRGDYINHPLFGNICNENYYNKAIKYMQINVSNPAFFIFSNDILWCKNQFNLPNATYIDGNIGCNSYIDMQLMSYCKHNIIANSSFSWWAAWLNHNENKMVVAPKKWLNNIDNEVIDIVPTQWIKL